MVKPIDQQTIIELYFYKMYNYSQLIEHFNNKYTYAEIKSVIKKHLENHK